MDRIINLAKRLPLTYLLILILILFGILVVLGYFKFFYKSEPNLLESEGTALLFDAEGPYAILTPRRDGNAFNLNLKRTYFYDAIIYELVYNSEGIDRGVSGEVDTNKKKGEYDQEILFGSCSKNVCKYDRAVENGTLTLRIKKGKSLYKMNTQWHLQKVDLAQGSLTSADGHFIYKVNAKKYDLGVVGFSIINDMSGLPKLPVGKEVFGKVYALNIPVAKKLPVGNVTIELVQTPPDDAKIARFEETTGWKILDTKIDGEGLTAGADGSGIFAVLVNSK